MQITQASLTDLEQIVAIERAGFTPKRREVARPSLTALITFPKPFWSPKWGTRSSVLSVDRP